MKQEVGERRRPFPMMPHLPPLAAPLRLMFYGGFLAGSFSPLMSLNPSLYLTTKSNQQLMRVLRSGVPGLWPPQASLLRPWPAAWVPLLIDMVMSSWFEWLQRVCLALAAVHGGQTFRLGAGALWLQRACFVMALEELGDVCVGHRLTLPTIAFVVFGSYTRREHSAVAREFLLCCIAVFMFLGGLGKIMGDGTSEVWPLWPSGQASVCHLLRHGRNRYLDRWPIVQRALAAARATVPDQYPTICLVASQAPCPCPPHAWF